MIDPTQSIPGLPSFALERSSGYKAADGTDGWTAVDDADINTILADDAQTVRYYVRDLVRNFPYFARAVGVLKTYLIGSGVMPQSNLPLENPYNKLIEDYIKRWMDNCDISGNCHFFDFQKLCISERCECGEFLFIEHLTGNDYKLQAIESDWISDDFTSEMSMDGNKVFINGIQINAVTGERIKYRFQNPNWYGLDRSLYFDVPANRVIHGFEVLRPGQLRGISPFVSGVTLSKQMSEYIGAEVNAAKIAARWLAFVETPDPTQKQMGLTEDDDGNKLEYMEEAIIEYLNSGEKVNFAQANRPGDTFVPFIKFCCQMFSVVTGVPYELISGSYEDLNYSTARVTRNDFTYELRPQFSFIVQKFCRPVIEKAVDVGVLSGKLKIPDYFSHREKYLSFSWPSPGTESIDPLKEAKSHRHDMESFVRSPVEIVAARGRDLADVLGEFKKAQDMADELGVSVDFFNMIGKSNVTIQDTNKI